MLLYPIERFEGGHVLPGASLGEAPCHLSDLLRTGSLGHVGVYWGFVKPWKQNATSDCWSPSMARL